MLSTDLRFWDFKDALRELPNPFMLTESISIRPDHLSAIGRALRRGASWSRRPLLLGVDRDERPASTSETHSFDRSRHAMRTLCLPAPDFRFP
ncbi:hypothetical protein, partial [Mycobacterium sp. KBS0706]|uniref:hypothetical protein n=1 Tax=Mycobacterium sp. KBS0706 TaxID=2578109 RepID=UPI001C8F8713